MNITELSNSRGIPITADISKWANFIYRCEIGHTHLDLIEDCDNLQSGAIRGLLIVLGLSVHELFEGLSIGLESSAHYVW